MLTRRSLYSYLLDSCYFINFEAMNNSCFLNLIHPSVRSIVVLMSIFLLFPPLRGAEAISFSPQNDSVYDPASKLFFTMTDYDMHEAKVAMSCEEKIGMMSYPELSGRIEIPETVKISGEEYTVTAIGNKAFSGNAGITQIILPESVREIGDYAFYSSSLREITFPPGVERIGTGCLEYCKNLERFVWLPESDCVIPEKAFAESGLKEVELGKGICSIDDYSFGGMGRLQSLSIDRSDPPVIIGMPFYRTELSFVSLFVPEDGVDAYSRSAEWSSLGFMEIVAGDEEILPSEIFLTSDKSEISVGESLQLAARMSPPGVTVRELVWASSVPDILGVSSEGVITGIAPGQAIVRVSSAAAPAVFAELPITVVSTAINGMTPTPVNVGEVRYLAGNMIFSHFPSNAFFRIFRVGGEMCAELTADDSGFVSVSLPENIYFVTATYGDISTLYVYKIIAK